MIRGRIRHVALPCALLVAACGQEEPTPQTARSQCEELGGQLRTNTMGSICVVAEPPSSPCPDTLPFPFETDEAIGCAAVPASSACTTQGASYLEDGDVRLCTLAQELVIVREFECPAQLPYRFEEEAYVICSSKRSLPPDLPSRHPVWFEPVPLECDPSTPVTWEPAFVTAIDAYGDNAQGKVDTQLELDIRPNAEGALNVRVCKTSRDGPSEFFGDPIWVVLKGLVDGKEQTFFEGEFKTTTEYRCSIVVTLDTSRKLWDGHQLNGFAQIVSPAYTQSYWGTGCDPSTEPIGSCWVMDLPRMTKQCR